jgi:phosphate transport system substrate-binding protein
MNLRKYYILATVMAVLVMPLLTSLILAALFILSFDIAFDDMNLFGVKFAAVLTILSAALWLPYCIKTKMPEKASQLFLPLFISFVYFMGVFVVLFALSGYRFDSSFFTPVFPLLTLQHFTIHFLFAFTSDYAFYPIYIAITTTTALLTIFITRKAKKEKIQFDKKVLVYAAICLVLSGIAVFQFYDRGSHILSADHGVEQIQDEIDYYEYMPFMPENKLQKLSETATISISDNYPRLDGATAAIPFYGAMAQELYKGLDRETVEQYVSCTRTNEAYERLINGEIDIFFGAEPSEQQQQAAKEKGLEFVLTPIAKEAFVFLVNKSNPIDGLSVEQIQDIYQKKIDNWSAVGGNNEAIAAFQRPENSGSQTTMLSKVMKGKALPMPLQEERPEGMGGLITQTATYRNYSSALGYSFRYYATGMNPNANIKLLAIDGMKPSVANIQDGSYPFTIDVYAVTTVPIDEGAAVGEDEGGSGREQPQAASQGSSSRAENTKKLIEWILSKQGQDLIEKSGYVRIAG